MDLLVQEGKVQVGRPSKYSDEFRADAVALYRASNRSSVKVIADGIGINHETLRQWGKAADERAELARLRKVEREWQLEREILRKAAQFFARDMN